MAFTGKVSYDDITLVGEDLSDFVEIFAPTETPLLDRLPTAGPALNTQYQWEEESLGPTTLTNSTAINSATADTGIQINGNGDKLTVGMTLQITGSNPRTDEHVRVVSVVGANSVLVARNVAGTGVDSLAAGGSLYVIGGSALEGDEAVYDISVLPTRRTNFTTIIRKVIKLSGTARAVRYGVDRGDQLDAQSSRRLMEAMRDLEKFVIRGVATNSVGTATVPRVMDGLMDVITTVNSTVTASSFTADPGLYIGNVWQQAWNQGARDIDLIVAGDQFKRDISGANISIARTTFEERRRVYKIDTIETDFGIVDVLLTPWLPSSWAIGLSTNRVRVVPMNGRSFFSEDLAKAGDTDKRHVVGEYTLEYHNPEGMFQIHT